jgi:hypothetical protein
MTDNCLLTGSVRFVTVPSQRGLSKAAERTQSGRSSKSGMPIIRLQKERLYV